jgi:hypothetical protein
MTYFCGPLAARDAATTHANGEIARGKCKEARGEQEGRILKMSKRCCYFVKLLPNGFRVWMV